MDKLLVLMELTGSVKCHYRTQSSESFANRVRYMTWVLSVLGQVLYKAVEDGPEVVT